MILNKAKNNRGFTLLVAIILTSVFLIISFVVVNVALKQLILANSSEESQYAFYAADSGTECAVYWDLKTPGSSPFTPGSITSISCNGQSVTPTIISDDGTTATSTFSINLPKGCVTVQVGKSVSGATRIYSRGYNTCGALDLRRFERGVHLSFDTGAPVSTICAVGGTVTTVGLYKIHTFTSSATLTLLCPLQLEYLLVAGGGGGGTGDNDNRGGGGGGAGGVILSVKVAPVGSIAITVGNGGTWENNGGNSSLGSYATAIGGGAGATGSVLNHNPGGNGGSGGGGARNAAGGTGVAGQGQNGGASIEYGPRANAGGGGGGKGAAGGNTPSDSVGGNGGNGLSFSITGFPIIYGGGGGGGGDSAGNQGSGGTGGGGSGGNGAPSRNGVNGTDGLGGGGGGGTGTGPSASFGGTGGKGVVIVRYLY